ncbi:DUF92 domain-containing protein [Draconibacterium halophilum]|uniref:DUF92 domain-containing protein n=1 Tax=Draconibacterium halophilum TaxID=2706887 RepID=A0A6C0R967_9BACT|nr:DUF92 domain-containing protein [Draconibacterium halophilum]QIA06482.1 DUF92 domain-containing protein [Draconibacterium halophilum]
MEAKEKEINTTTSLATRKKAFMVRKLVHLFTGLLILLLTYTIERHVLFILIIVGSIISFVTFRFKSWRLIHQTDNKSLGTLFYPLGILISFQLLADLPMYYFQSALMVLTVSDPLANVFGQINKRNRIFRIGKDKKSIYGVMAYSLSNLVVLLVFLPHVLLADVFFVVALLLLAAYCEVISWRGSDNLSIPIGLALFFIFQHTQQPDFLFVSVVLTVIGAGAYLLYKWKLLTRYGSLAAGLLGFYLSLVAGWNWLLPVLFFFASSVIFTKVNPTDRKKKSQLGGRNAWQVVANILWALLSSMLFFITKNELFIFFFIASVAAVTADTWASEAGPLLNKRSFSVADWKMHKAGTTGGISLGGTAAALAGAFLISALSYNWFFDAWNQTEIALLTLSAFLACFADTFLGAFIEGKLHQLTFFRKQQKPESITPNDLVNLGGSFTAWVFFLVLYFLVL